MRALVLVLLLAACAPAAKGKSPTPRPLEGTSWVLVLDRPEQYATPTLEFNAGGRANGFTGCNQWFAQVDRGNNGMRFDAIGMTRRGCEPAAMEIEREFANRLEQTRAVQVEGDVLTLTGENGEPVATFQRAT
jgi:heat shock protein HslJ